MTALNIFVLMSRLNEIREETDRYFDVRREKRTKKSS